MADNALDIYRKVLNFNFVLRYDARAKQIIYQTPHAVAYKFDETSDNWEKLEYQGPLMFYERNIDDDSVPLEFRDNYKHGLMIANRQNPKNISLGIIPKSITSRFFQFYRGLSYDIQNANDLLMLKNCLGEVYGLWIHDIKDRKVFYDYINYAINS